MILESFRNDFIAKYHKIYLTKPQYKKSHFCSYSLCTTVLAAVLPPFSSTVFLRLTSWLLNRNESSFPSSLLLLNDGAQILDSSAFSACLKAAADHLFYKTQSALIINC